MHDAHLSLQLKCATRLYTDYTIVWLGQRVGIRLTAFDDEPGQIRKVFCIGYRFYIFLKSQVRSRDFGEAITETV